MDCDSLNFRPPVLVGERVAWLGSGSGLPLGATVKWIGRIPEITNGWTVGIELDRAMPVGGIDGTWRKRKLFSCEPKHGLLVPIDKIVKESSLLKTRHSVGESFYNEGAKPPNEKSQALLRQLSLPQSQTSQEFIARVLPPTDRKHSISQEEAAALNFKLAASRINLISPAESKEKLLTDTGNRGTTVSLERGVLPPYNSIKSKHCESEELLRTPSLNDPKVAPLSVKNVKSFEESGCVSAQPLNKTHDWAATCEEWEKFKKYLDTVSNFSNNSNEKHNSHSRRRIKIGKNPNSLYASAKPEDDLETSLALRLIGERKDTNDKRSTLKKEDLIIEEESLEIPYREPAHEKAEVNLIKHSNQGKETNVSRSNQKHNFDFKDLPPIGQSNLNSVINKKEGRKHSDITSPLEIVNGSSPLDKGERSLSLKDIRSFAEKETYIESKSKDNFRKQANTVSVTVNEKSISNHAEIGQSKNIHDTEKGNELSTSPQNSSSERKSETASAISGNKVIRNLREENYYDLDVPLDNHRQLIKDNSLNTGSKEENATQTNIRVKYIDKNKEKVDLGVQTAPTIFKKLPVLDLKEAKLEDLPYIEDLLLSELEVEKVDEIQAAANFEENNCENKAVANDVDVSYAAEVENASESVPAPTLRRKRQPVPTPRRKLKDDRREDDESFDTASVLYEPAFLRAYCDEGPDRNSMTEIHGTFRKIDEDDIDRPAISKQHRVLSSSVSNPDSSKKGLFSFFRWFKKNKNVEDLDLDALNSASAASSPVFPRSVRIASAESVDTLYSIATASSFAFVPASQYQKERYGTIERRKKRRAPQPPTGEASLPNTLEFRGKISHRRSASESYKDGRFAHVQGKRRAPPPPVPNSRLYPTLSAVKDSNYSSLSRKKRPAPQPPERVQEEEHSAEDLEAPLLIAEEVQAPIEQALTCESSEMGIPTNDENVVCNDTLKLERGVLKPTKTPSVTPDVAKVVPLSPVSPRPWYKRKSLEKKKEKYSEDWMPEVGFSRSGLSTDFSPLKLFFSRGNEDKKKEEKRKSGISMLVNISELDREAAEICRRDQVQQQLKLAADDAKFYHDPLELLSRGESGNEDPPRRNSTKELISLFNSIGSSTKLTVNPSALQKQNGVLPYSKDDEDLAVVTANRPEIKTAVVVETKDFVNEEPKPSTSKTEIFEMTEDEASSKSKYLFEGRNHRHHSPSLTISTITELSEPSSSAATLNQYAEPVWKCTRCTLENAQWRNRCDACSACKPNYTPARKSLPSSPRHRRKSEMDFEIDWEQELRKYFPGKTHQKDVPEISAKLTLSKTGDVQIKTETNETKEKMDIDEIRRRRMAFFMKSFGSEGTSIRDAAARQSLDETEKLKLKGMLKEMKESLPKREVINNASSNLSADKSTRPDVACQKNEPTNLPAPSPLNVSNDEATKYGAIKRIKKEENCKQEEKAEALLITTTTVFEDIIVRKKKNTPEKVEKDQQTSPVVEIPVLNFSTVGMKNGEPYTASKMARRIGDGPFELMRARDLANIIETKTGTPFPAHVYANIPGVRQSEEINELDEDKLTTAAGLAKFKASLDPLATDTIAVNRLLRKLEGAIADGRHDQAAALARELAVLKVSCSVIRQRPSPSPSPTAITVEMYVEDKVSHQGPIPMQLQRSMTLTQLKEKVKIDLNIPNHVQRWILGRQLATDENKTLEELGVNEDRCPIFLYLVAPEAEPEPVESKTKTSTQKAEGASNVQNSENAFGERKEKDGPPLGKGWYYNYEEDRYSFCGSESEESPEREVSGHTKADAVKVIQRTIEAVQENSKSKSVTPSNERRIFNKEDPMVPQPVVQAKPYQPRPQKNPLKASLSLPEQDLPSNDAIKNLKTEPGTSEGVITKNGKKKEEKPTSSKPIQPEQSPTARPRSRSIFDLMKPQSNDTLKKDLKLISVNVKETIEMLSRKSEDISRQGWKCALCTLVNPVTRPGCAACTSPRPPGYAPPPTRAAEDELRRLRRDQAAEFNPLMEPRGKDPVQASGSQTYLQLVNLDSADVVMNTEEFECPVCMINQAVGEGVILRECLHNFCRTCLAQTIQYNEEAEVKCPFRDDSYTCESVLQEREIKALVPPGVWEQHLARSVSQAENRIGNTFHCKTPDCKGWCIVEDNVNEYRCPVCKHNNCLTCQTIHEGLDCRQYQERLKNNCETDAEAKRTRSMLEEMVQRGDAMACPTCQVVLMKKWGCDWLRCSMCKTEICWVTRGPRWGPAGKGDTSAGCQCGVNGVKCHPKCNYCH